jgi:beta-phosphoglucomutase
MSHYEAILFDFDGVLVDSEPVHFECWREILKPFGLELDWVTYCEQGIGVSDRDLLALISRQKTPPVNVETLFAEYPRKRDLFRSRMLERQAFSEDVVHLISRLSRHRLGVVTSSGRNEVEPILSAGGILEHFHVAVYGGDVRRLKPAPDPYLLAVERLRVSKALVVEDSDAGEASGRAAGLDVLRIHHQDEMVAAVTRFLGL